MGEGATGHAGWWDHQLTMLMAFLGPSLAGALKLVQIPAGARHIQIEELEKAPYRIGECQGAGRGAARPGSCPQVWGSGRVQERILMQGGVHKFE